MTTRGRKNAIFAGPRFPIVTPHKLYNSEFSGYEWFNQAEQKALVSVLMSNTVLEPKPPDLSGGGLYCGQTGVPPVVDRRPACVVTVSAVVVDRLRL